MNSWKSSYDALVGAMNLSLPPHESRMHPRFEMGDDMNMLVQFGGEHPRVHNISAGGMSLYTDNPIAGGSSVALTLENAIRVHSEVVYCSPDGPKGADGGHTYQVGLKFLTKNDGYRVAVLAMETCGGKVSEVTL